MFYLFLEASLLEVTQCEHGSATTTVKEKLQGQIVQDSLHTLVWTKLCFVPCHLSDFIIQQAEGHVLLLAVARKKSLWTKSGLNWRQVTCLGLSVLWLDSGFRRNSAETVSRYSVIQGTLFHTRRHFFRGRFLALIKTKGAPFVAC